MGRLVLVITVVLTCCRPAELPTQKIADQIESLILEGKYKDAQAFLGTQRRNTKSPNKAFWQVRLLESEVLFELRYDEMAWQHLQKIPKIMDLDLQANRSMLHALYFIRRGKYSESRKLLLHAVDQAEKSGSFRVLAKLKNMEAFLHLVAGNLDAAEKADLAALRGARRVNDQVTRIKSLNNLGIIYLNQGRYDQMAIHLEEASQLTDETYPQFGVLLINLGLAKSLLGYNEQASSLLHRAVALNKKQNPTHFQKALGELGSHYYRQGNLKNALVYFKEAFQIAKQIENWQDAGLWAGNICSIYIELHDWANADLWVNRATENTLAAGHKENLKFILAKRTMIATGMCELDTALELVSRLIQEADKADNPNFRWRVQTHLARVFLAMGKEDEAARFFQDALDIIEENPGMTEPSDQIAYFARLTRFYGVFVKMLMKKAQYEHALAVVEASRARFMRMRAPTPIEDLNDLVARAQKHKRVFFSYWLDEHSPNLWVISKHGMEVFPMPEQATVAKLVKQHQQAITRLKPGGEAGRKLFDLLIAPAAGHLYADAEVVLIPDGPLRHLAFETLPSPTPGHRYWIEDVTLSISPSLNLHLQNQATPPNLGRVLLIGNPAYQSKAYPPLAASVGELDSIRRRLPQAQITTLAGEEAHRDAFFQAQPDTYSIIHFAAHAEVNATFYEDSAVILSPHQDLTETKIYARDIQAYPLQGVDLVTLSACRSAGVESYAGEGLMGFAWAFLWSGVQNVVASTWNVDDRAAAKIMDGFYGRLQAGERPNHALRKAKLELIEGGGQYGKPYYWGAFQIFVR